jgi:hypothetical protein
MSAGSVVIFDFAERLDFDIPELAWNNSEYEYIFVHHVPDSAVVDWIDL